MKIETCRKDNVMDNSLLLNREKLMEKIQCYIIENNLLPNTKLPSEREFCSMWDCNRTTLKKAIDQLINHGKLYKKKGSGTFLSEPKLEKNLQSLNSFHEFIDENSLNLSTKLLSLKLLNDNTLAYENLKESSNNNLCELIRLRSVDSVPFAIENSYLSSKYYDELIRKDFEKTSLYEVLKKDFNLNLKSGWEEISMTYATALESELLKVEEGFPLFYLKGTVLEEKGFPVEFFYSVIRADIVKLKSVLTR